MSPTVTIDADRYRFELARLGIDYYVLGRGAATTLFSHVSATNLHHSVELLLKAALLKVGNAISDLKKKFGHNIGKMWLAVRPPNLAPHDPTIAALDKFEAIRYPDEYLREGATIEIGWKVSTTGASLSHYSVGIDAIDLLVVDLLDLASINIKAFRLPQSGQEAVVKYNAQAARWQEPGSPGSPSTHDQAKSIANMLWLHRGCPMSDDWGDWFLAESIMAACNGF
jgi:hypothetical protein